MLALRHHESLRLFDLIVRRWHHHGEREDASLQLPAAQPYFASVSPAQMLADDKPEANSPIIHLTGVFELAKLFEKTLLIAFTNADTCVLNLDQDATVALQVRSIDFHETVLICELQCIVDQIDHDLL